MKIRVKKLCSEAVIPSYAKEGDAGLDLVATSHDSEPGYESYGTGLAIEIPKGFLGFVLPRSSVTKMDLMLKNSVGLIDSGYRGEVMLRFQRLDDEVYTYDIGDKIGQLVILPYPHIELEEAQELTSTDRGAGGYGSTGK